MTDRRTFLKYTALSGGLLLAGGCAERAEIPEGLFIPGIMEPPHQSIISQKDRAWQTFKGVHGAEMFKYQRVASYSFTALVVIKEDRIDDEFGVTCPLDLVLAWGPFADTSLLKKFNVAYQNRYFKWKTEQSSYVGQSAQTLAQSIANTHFVETNYLLFEELREVKVNSVLRMKGFLVNVRNEATGATMRTSLRRTDSGWGSCEVVEPVSFEILEKL